MRKFLIALCLLSLPLFASESPTIVFPGKRQMSLRDHMVYFLRKIPMSFMQGGAVKADGLLAIDLRAVAPEMAASIRTELEKGKTGGLEISGARVDLSQAELIFTSSEQKREDPLADTAPVQPDAPAFTRVTESDLAFLMEVQERSSPLAFAQQMEAQGCEGMFLVNVAP